MRRLPSTATVALALTFLSACAQDRGAIRVGFKDFAEQEILSEMLVQLLRDRGHRAEVVPCGDTYACQRSLRSGRLDLMVEYSGTGLQFVGGPEPDREAPIAQLGSLYEPLGLRWLEPLGFDNGYRILVPGDRAAALGLEAIGDLDRLEEGLRVACPAEFLRRPRDGLAGMMRRYGLQLAQDPLIVADPTDRFHAVVDGSADVAVGYSTDGAILGLGLTVLRDDLEFFPPYQAAVLVREDLLREEDGLADELSVLGGRLADEEMLELNYAVQVEGRTPRNVAADFLRRMRLVEPPQASEARRAPLRVTVRAGEEGEAETARALRAAREVFPERPVSAVAAPDPVAELAAGRASLAVLWAERFFPGGGRRERRITALAVLGSRLAHLVTRGDGREGRGSFGQRVGIAPAGTSDGRVAEALLSSESSTPGRRAEATELLEALAAGDLDAVLLVAAVGDEEIARAMARNEDLSLRPLGQWLDAERAVSMPFLRRARVPARTYARQDESVETVGVQIVMAGAAARDSAGGAGSPAGALPSASFLLTAEQTDQLAVATGVLEGPDPALPSPWTTASPESAASSLVATTTDGVLNVAVIAFLIWLVALLLGRRERDAGS